MRKSSSDTKKGVKVTAKEMEQLLSVLKPNIRAVVKEGVEQYIGNGTRFMLELLMHAEAQELCGKWNSRPQKRELSRWGTEKNATALIGGAKRQIDRPRVRIRRGLEGESSEVQLQSYEAMNRNELLDGPLMAAILSGVSARNYVKIVSRGLEMKGVKKSAVSRKVIAATKPTVDEFRKRAIDQHDLAVLIFDGVHVGKRQIICCIGIDMNGKKHVLGLRVGATENEIVCRDLIRDLIERGLSTKKQYLFAVDGSKALIAAIRAAFGQDAAIQRCQEHKIRDVQGYLPVKLRAELRFKMQAAYNRRSEKQALQSLALIRSQLSLISENAVNALTEGMLETLTLHRLGITGLLRKSLRTTNIIESAFSSVRRYMGRVSNFKDEAQRELWVTRSILETERHFRSLRGCRQLRKLRQELELRHCEINRRQTEGADEHV
jgi:putative transposase